MVDLRVCLHFQTKRSQKDRQVSNDDIIVGIMNRFRLKCWSLFKNSQNEISEMVKVRVIYKRNDIRGKRNERMLNIQEKHENYKKL